MAEKYDSNDFDEMVIKKISWNKPRFGKQPKLLHTFNNFFFDTKNCKFVFCCKPRRPNLNTFPKGSTHTPNNTFGIASFVFVS